MRCIDSCFAASNKSENELVGCFKSQCQCSEEYFQVGQKFLPEGGPKAVFVPPPPLQRLVLKQKKGKKEVEEYFAKAVFDIEFTILPSNVCCLNF